MAGFPKGLDRVGIKAKQAGNGTKIDSELIRKALAKHRGNLSRAADSIGCCRQTLYSRCKDDPELQAFLTSFRERFLDESEDVLQEKVLSGDTTSLLFTLKTIGRKRGYDMDNNQVVESVTRGALDWIMNKSKNPAE
jgi:hypothetical protein